ncbi:type IV conjugative transfer system protein TraE (plasmid) [Candidatus Bandiella numerosa]|uniref:TraE/TraK family type IV conjugative transfer system protein n=1 Tax=Candidatus Bandiella numerosa TaxID=2570586 RepID=UPI00249E47E3|nr:TraE/TraK family type IV conjugative transfer system protein [Candidatus Bandiella numerosa]WHA05652.1 type IV conjugative transfer system protein TraE [Candidatus Bandiella numerosa]
MERKLRVERNLFIVGFIIMVMSNLILVICIYRGKSTTILVPGIEQRFEVSSESASSEYLKLRAQEIHFLIFGMNNENSKRMRELLLMNIDNEARNNFIKQIDEYALNIENKGYYYNFSDIVEYGINKKELVVKISGYLETFIGEEKINREYKSYKYEFINRGGRVLLHSFKEAQDVEE